MNPIYLPIARSVLIDEHSYKKRSAASPSGNQQFGTTFISTIAELEDKGVLSISDLTNIRGISNIFDSGRLSISVKTYDEAHVQLYNLLEKLSSSKSGASYLAGVASIFNNGKITINSLTQLNNRVNINDSSRLLISARTYDEAHGSIYDLLEKINGSKAGSAYVGGIVSLFNKAKIILGPLTQLDNIVRINDSGKISINSRANLSSISQISDIGRINISDKTTLSSISSLFDKSFITINGRSSIGGVSALYDKGTLTVSGQSSLQCDTLVFDKVKLTLGPFNNIQAIIRITDTGKLLISGAKTYENAHVQLATNLQIPVTQNPVFLACHALLYNYANLLLSNKSNIQNIVQNWDRSKLSILNNSSLSFCSSINDRGGLKPNYKTSIDCVLIIQDTGNITIVDKTFLAGVAKTSDFATRLIQSSTNLISASKIYDKHNTVLGSFTSLANKVLLNNKSVMHMAGHSFVSSVSNLHDASIINMTDGKTYLLCGGIIYDLGERHSSTDLERVYFTLNIEQLRQFVLNIGSLQNFILNINPTK